MMFRLVDSCYALYLPIVDMVFAFNSCLEQFLLLYVVQEMIVATVPVCSVLNAKTISF